MNCHWHLQTAIPVTALRNTIGAATSPFKQEADNTYSTAVHIQNN